MTETPEQQKQRIIDATAIEVLLLVEAGTPVEAVGLIVYRWLIEARIEIENIKANRSETGIDRSRAN